MERGYSVAHNSTAPLLQLYIKVSEDSSPQQPLDGTDHAPSEDTEAQASAVELTDPHLSMLSKFWLAALKDKAYLFLPAEFSNQLPPLGGTFYSVDVMESVRPYYGSNWSSLLHAAAIWLREKGFREMGGDEESSGTGLPTPLLSDSSSSFCPPATSDPKVANFHLILGLSVQSLCAPATLDQPNVLSSCLRALQRLLSSDTASQLLSSDYRLSVELLGMLHRLLLTCQTMPTHILALRIAVLVSNILGEAVRRCPVVVPPPDELRGVATNEPSPSADSAKETVSVMMPVAMEASIEPGKSCTYALLEVVSCCLLRLIPSLKIAENQPRPPSSSSSSSFGSAHLPSKDDLVAISLSMKILAVSCGLCTPDATPTVLAPVLHLLLSALGFVSTLALPALQTVPHLPTATFQSFSQLCAGLPMSHDSAGPQLGQILQSALTSVLGGYVSEVKGQGALEMSEESRLVVVALLICAASPQNICPAASKLFDGCVELFRKCLHSGDPKVYCA